MGWAPPSEAGTGAPPTQGGSVPKVCQLLSLTQCPQRLSSAFGASPGAVTDPTGGPGALPTPAEAPDVRPPLPGCCQNPNVRGLRAGGQGVMPSWEPKKLSLTPSRAWARGDGTPRVGAEQPGGLGRPHTSPPKGQELLWQHPQADLLLPHTAPCSWPRLALHPPRRAAAPPALAVLFLPTLPCSPRSPGCW